MIHHRSSRSRTFNVLATLAAAGVICALTARAGAVVVHSTLAADTASSPAYANGWTNGSNGGTGFGPWVQIPFNYNHTNSQGNPLAGFLINTSSTAYGTTATPNIDTAGSSFDVYADYATAGLAADPVAYRPFTAPLSVGQTFSMNVLTGYINGFGEEGFQLQNAAGGAATPLFQFAASGAGTDYGINYGANLSNAIDTGIVAANNANGVNVAVTLTGPDTISATVTPLALGATPAVFSNLSLGSGSLNQLMLFNDNLTYGGTQDAYFNSLAITGVPAIPEPATLGLLGVGALALLATRRKRESARLHRG